LFKANGVNEMEGEEEQQLLLRRSLPKPLSSGKHR